MPIDTPSLPASSSNPPAPAYTYNRQPPAIALSGQNSEITGSSFSLPGAGSPMIGLESPTILSSSRISGDMGAPRSGMNHSSPVHQKDLQFGFDCDTGTGGRMIVSLNSGAVDNRQDEFIAEPGLVCASHSRNVDNCSSGVQAATELTCVDTGAALDGQSFPVHTHAGQSASGMIPSPESYGEPQRPYSPPSSARKSPEIYTPQVGTRPSTGHIDPQSPASAYLILPQCGSVSTLDPADTAMRCTPSLSHESQSLHHPPFPQPPLEVTALLTAESSGDVVSPVFARGSPLVPWELPSEIGHFWLGLFKIPEVKVTHVYHTVSRLFSLCCGSVCSLGGNEFTTKLLECTYSTTRLALFTRMGAWWRGSTPR